MPVSIMESSGFYRKASAEEVKVLAETGGRQRQGLRGMLHNPNLRANLDLWISTANDPHNPEFVLAEALANIEGLGVSITKPADKTVFIRVSPQGRESLAMVFRTIEYQNAVTNKDVNPENLRQQIAEAINKAFLLSR
ncbi:hypothetical protein HYS29_02430 [Candidatus Microgenomates bacterium]|nr:hypothetical protein [Candidatus Microgenomates bacterium]